MASLLSPSRTVITSFTPRRPSLLSVEGAASFDDGDWVLSLASSSEALFQRTIACALSNGQVLVYDQNRLHPVATYNQVHGQSLSSQLTYGPEGTIISIGMDGSLALLDTRQGNNTVAARASLPTGQSALSISLGFDGYVAAVGSDKARIHFFDLRSTKLVGSYVDSHMDMVTTLQFRPGTSTLVSGSEDGLVCIFDTTQPTEEAALKTVLNVGAPVRMVGFCGDVDRASASTVFCLTGSESASLWNYETATCIRDFGFELRQQLQRLAPSMPSIDYLVKAHWDVSSQELLLTAGNAQGGAALYRLTRQQNGATSYNGDHLNWELCHVLEGGHRGVVRDVCHLSQSVLVTAGEDARLCEWNRLVPQAHAAKSCAKQIDISWAQYRPADASIAGPLHGTGGGPVRRPRSRQKCGPY
jgi:WD repeat-containing protein 89